MRTIISLILGMVFLGVAVQAEDGWKKIENSSFSFAVPSTFKQTEAHGIDSFEEEYAADGITISFDYGMYSDDFADWPKDTKFEPLKVDGKSARIGTVAQEFEKGFPFVQKGFPYWIMVHVKLDADTSLSMFAACRSQKEVALARRIFGTIALKAKKA